MNQWPLIQKLVESEYFDFIDFAIAEHLSKRYSFSNEATAAFLCYLSLALRQGHLCVKVNEEQIVPDPISIHKKKSETVSLQDILSLNHLLKKSIKTHLGVILNDVHQEHGNNADAPVYQSGDLYYFQRYWQYEQDIHEHILSIDQAKPFLQPDIQKVLQHVNSLIEKKSILPLQAEAILKGCQNNITIINGGPGTGKTYTAGELLKALWLALSEKDKKQFSLILAAPTGKAASQLEHSLIRATENIENFPRLKAKTLHSLLKLKGSNSSDEENKINAKIIVVDECSMMDATMMSKFFAAVPLGTKVILLGDKYQLPPVSAGMLFADIIDILSERERCIELKQCLRTDLKSILDFAECIKMGKSEEAIQQLLQENNPIRLSALNFETNIKKQQNEIVERSFQQISRQMVVEPTADTLNKALQTFCLLSPFRQGPFGTVQLNLLFLQKLISAERHADVLAIPIVISNNNQRFELSNGEMGLLIYHFERQRKQPSEGVLEVKEGDYALFLNKNIDQDVRRIPALLLPKYECAFCLSVHKSQGSEYQNVMLLMPLGSELFGRELLYTAVTRARKGLEILSTPDIIRQTIDNHASRLSGLRQQI